VLDKARQEALEKADKTRGQVSSTIKDEHDERIFAAENALMGRIDLLFCPLLTSQVAQKLKSLRMDLVAVCSTASVTNYIAKFQRFTTLYKARLPDAHSLCLLFIDGLQPTELRLFVKNQGLQKWTDARAQAMAQSRILEATQWRPPPSKPLAPKPPSEKDKTFVTSRQRRFKDQERKEPPSETRPRLGDKEAQPRPPDKKKCFECGQVGHIRANCPQKKEESFALVDCEILAPVIPSPVECTNGPWINGHVANTGVKLRILLDTGASRNYVSPRIVKSLHTLGHAVEVKPVRRQAATANGAILNSEEDVLLTLATPHGEIADWFTVATIPADVFLGYVTLRAYGIVEDMTMPKLVKPEPPCVPRPLKLTPRTERTKQDAPVIKHSFEPESTEDLVDMGAVGDSPADPAGSKIFIEPSFPLVGKLEEVLETFAEVSSEILPPCNNAGEIQIRLMNPHAPPVCIPPRRTSKANETVIEQKLDDMLAQGIIRPSVSTYSSPVVIVRKPGADPRFCIDYKGLNKLLLRPAYPMKDTRVLIRNLVGNQYFGILDLKSGFHQIQLSTESIMYTAFATHRGLYEFLKLPFGICIAPQEFQQIMSRLLHGIPGVDVYVDDVIIAAPTAELFVERVRDTFRRLQNAELRIKPSKCKLGVSTVVFLGHQVDGTGVQLTKDRREAFLLLKCPTNIAELRTFLGMTTYFRQFIPDFALLAKPLLDLLKKGTAFCWTTIQEEAFQAIKKKLFEAPVLQHINYSHRIVIRTDASQDGIGAVLLQENSETGTRHPIAYLSKSFTAQQRKWSTIEAEGYAIYFAICHWHDFLAGHAFVVETDHANLRYLEKADAPKLVRWRLQLANYDFSVRHIPGKSNLIADALSRLCALVDVADDTIISRYHNNVAGHLGITATIRAMQVDGWDHEDLPKAVESFVQHCLVCQKIKAHGPTVAYDQRPTAKLVPWAHVSIDTLGPLPKDSDGSQYIIVVIDRFSRFVELFATKTCNAKAAASALLAVFSRYGPPLSVRSDQGPQFVSSVVEEFLRLLQIEHELTIPYHPAANGMVERVNAEVLKHLKAIVHAREVRSTWSTYLPLVARTINNSWHSAIDTCPSRLVLGTVSSLQHRSLMTADAAVDFDSVEVNAISNEYLTHLIQAQRIILQKAADHQEKLLRHLQDKYKADQPTAVTVGSYVLWKPPTQADKLAVAWIGPYEVTSTTEAQLNAVKIQDVVTKKERTVHVKTLKPFKFKSTQQLTEAATFGSQALARVDHIVEHALDAPTGIYMFKVRWSGYGPEGDTWELLETVNDLTAFEAYLQQNSELRDLLNLRE
jgi:hypothetical protein